MNARCYSLPYPVSVNRYWTISAKTRRIIPTTEGRAWKSEARKTLQSQGAMMTDGPVSVAIVLHPRANKDGSASLMRLDLDNVLKVALDCLQSVVYINDSLVHSLNVTLGGPMDGGGLTVSVRCM
jgi:crossover junction endodeoxyribonuclease RusA